MKKYYLGIDGGGTKTAGLLTNEEGTSLAAHTTTGSSYRDIGIEGVLAVLKQLVNHCLHQAGISVEELAKMVIGLPCFGESKEMDAAIEMKIKAAFAPTPCVVTNDVLVGWAGSLGLKNGIHIVSGTGSIAYGKNQSQETARCGGWSSYFGDEGSCCWLGRRMMELFSKQAEQRAERGALYDLVMEHFKLKEAIDFIDIMEQQYVDDRDKVASLQRLLLLAAQEKDPEAIKLYESAAAELALLVKGISQQLHFSEETFLVSYSGGLFHAKELVLDPLSKAVTKLGGSLCPPLLLPVEGAVLLAMDMFAECEQKSVIESLRKSRRG